MGTAGRTRTNNVHTKVQDDFKVQLNEDSLYELNSMYTVLSVPMFMDPLRIVGKPLQFEANSD